MTIQEKFIIMKYYTDKILGLNLSDKQIMDFINSKYNKEKFVEQLKYYQFLINEQQK
jgi:RNase adaptor protein for sRNA GlmZ degradation